MVETHHLPVSADVISARKWCSDAAEIALLTTLLAIPEDVQIAIITPFRTCKILFVFSAHKHTFLYFFLL